MRVKFPRPMRALLAPFHISYPILNYIINTILLWWLIIQRSLPANFGKYFVYGVYPYTLFELWAYAVEGTKPSCT
jgi:hypothetical protein